MTLSDEQAVKATEDYFVEWITKRPEDPKDWALRRFELFREPVAKGLDSQGLQDYLKVALKTERSGAFCKRLLKEIKRKLGTQSAKKTPETTARS